MGNRVYCYWGIGRYHNLEYGYTKKIKKGLMPMMDKSKLSVIGEHIEKSRNKLNDLVMECKDSNLCSDELLKMSQELDDLINIYVKAAGNTSKTN